MRGIACAALGCILFAVACSPGEAPAETAAAETRLGEPMAPEQVSEEVDRLRTECRSLADPSPCYDEALSTLARTDVRQALSVLDALSRVDPSVTSNGHMYVHAIGIAAYDPERDFGELFHSCTELFHAGCYHGLIQARFAEEGEITKEVVSSLCEEVVPDPDADRWTYFQCLHGIGHGLVIHADHDLIEGLAGCDLLDDDWANASCQGGAFMENVGNATHPHHAALMSSLGGHGEMAAGAHDGHGEAHGAGEHGQGEHGGHAMKAAFKAIDPSDPHYPCSIVEPHQRSSCYEMQTSVILYLNGYDFGAAAETCDEVEEPWRTVCHRSLGRDASGHASRDITAVLNLCGADRSSSAPFCYVGAAKAAIDWSGEPRDGIALCAAVDGDESRLRCFEAVGEQIAVVAPGEKRGRQLCGALTGRDQVACLLGADLLSERPGFMPPSMAGSG